jgi:dihydrofolate synthase / folylpolyglutamate synthase
VSSRLSPAEVGSATEWVASLSPWPEEFGLERMHRLLDRIGHPERRYAAIHVVGTNGKSTATRRIAALLQREGRRAGAYTSPHVRGWAERIWVDGSEADFEQAVARVRGDAEAVGATQFEILTAAALAEFAVQRVEVAVVEAGLGGRLDATNVVDAEIVLLTNVSLEHTDVLGETPDQIAQEKLAVAHAARVVVLSDNDYARFVPKSAKIVTGGAREAAEAFLGRSISDDPHVHLPGRLERRGRELWDGAHNAAATRWLRAQLEGTSYDVVVCSILRDKDANAMLADLGALAPTLIATESSNPRALAAGELANLAVPHFQTVKTEPNPNRALARARESTRGGILVTGSLYLLADLAHGS